MPAHPGDAAGMEAAGNTARVAKRATRIHSMTSDESPVTPGESRLCTEEGRPAALMTRTFLMQPTDL